MELHRAQEAQLLRCSIRSVFSSTSKRFSTHRPISRQSCPLLSARGRANRKQLKACAAEGKITKQVISAIPQVRQWRSTNAEFREAERREADVLGPEYYRSPRTDFERLTAALDVAAQALDLLQAGHPSWEVLGRQLGRESVAARHLGEAGETLEQRMQQWAEHLVLLEESETAPLRERAPDEVAGWAKEVSPILHGVLELIESNRDLFGKASTLTDVREVLIARKSVQDAQREIELHEADARREFEEMFNGSSTDWDYVSESSEWAEQFVQQLGPDLLPQVIAVVLTIPLPTEDLQRRASECEKRFNAVTEWFVGGQFDLARSELGGRFDDAEAFLESLRETLPDIEEWRLHNGAIEQLRGLRLFELTEYSAAECLPSELVAATVERAILRAWIDSVLASDDRCEPGRSDARDQLVEEFQELDRTVVAHAAGRVIEVVNRHRPNSAIGEFGLIRTEAEKKTRHRPIKVLLEAAPAAAKALKPCFMMSPLTVSQFLPSSFRFDAVIFDEASQVRPGDAIGSLYRGKQLIVAGDNQQLPPSDFFERASDGGSDGWNPDDLDVFDSVLDLCRKTTTIPELPLRWHYRSRHEDLITYSNHAFYGGRLITYPSATEKGDDLGIEFIHVPEGIYQRGTSSHR